MGFLLLLYAGLLVYGSWYPFAWGEPLAPPLTFLHSLPTYLDKGDVIQNVLVYMPFGLLVVAWCGRRLPFAVGLLLAAITGTALSLGIETVQQYLPSRVPSLVDVAMNFGGSVIGGLLGALVSRHTMPGATFLRLRDSWFRPGPLASTGLIVIALWVLSQTTPLVPSLDIAQLRSKLGYLYRSMMEPYWFSWGKLATLWCYQVALGILLCTLLHAGRPPLRLYLLLAGFVCGWKMLVVGRVLSLEMLAAVALALLALAVLRRLRPNVLAMAGVALLAAGLAIYELLPGDAQVLQTSFNWVPFEGQMNDLSGLENILEFLWPPMAMACLLRQALPFHRQDAGAVIGTAVLALGMFMLEWLQQSLPGRYGDITQVVLACVGWVIPWCVRVRHAPAAGPGRHPAPSHG
ncbi:VanZ family protein [Pseudoduganella umbonata]|uniref:VanZ family protein n=1 Tax=Pseudoduganella umbonata TaxID=864828 RepID=A0A4P8HTZ2_9BURK|nr:VanZ family protein [Pseudoduganella umbonata]MBB3223841.1 VanZ family protein [Pseudoduganella umbonata]QCP12746.1 VanZ family protein [Pseudoduganella umbonata]